MKNLKKHNNVNSAQRSLMQWVGLFMCIGFLIMMACEHDTGVEPVGPGPGPDPIDTTGNPIDTSTTGGTPCDPNKVYFEMEILPLLKSNCAKSGCHDAATHEEGIILDSYQNVMNSDVIEPFDLDDSDLYEVITEDDDDKQMPPPPNQRLNPDQINL